MLISLILSLHAAYASINPVGDGEGYAIRGFALYGYLHSGQWINFWNLFERPNQSICPLHYLVFFVLPQSLAGTSSYVIIQDFVTFLILAFAVWKLCHVLRRPEWAPVIYLLCSVNNVALSDFNLFYLDMEFFALGLLSIALQVSAWEKRRFFGSFLSGLTLGSLFWIKPANAVIFLATFTLSEAAHAVSVFASKSEKGLGQRFLGLCRHWLDQSLGFFPVLCMAMFCGGGQTILQLIHNNEVYQSSTPLECGGLIRLFYFPLCLSFFYHVILLGFLLLAAFWVNRSISDKDNQKEITLFPFHLFIPIAVAYLILGEFFSFGMLLKPMRSLLILLPIVWIAGCWVGEKFRLRVELMFLVALAYTFFAFSQKAFDLLDTRSAPREDTYQLSADSWTQMPSPWFRGIGVNRAICDGVRKNAPPSGIICVNSIELQKLLTWRLDSTDLLCGKPPSYEIRNIFNSKGDYFNQSLVGAYLFILKISPAVQANEVVRLESMDILDYCNKLWTEKREGVRGVELHADSGEPLGYEIFFSHPLTKDEIASANQSVPFSKMRQEVDDGSSSFEGRHFSRAEAWQLLKAWYDKRVGALP